MPTLSSRRRPWPFDMRLGLVPVPVQHNRIGDYRGSTIGSLRPLTIGQLRTQKATDVVQHGLMLVPSQQNGLLLGKKQTPLDNNYPQSAEYGSAPVYKEHTFEFRPTGGMGEATQTSHTDRRYHFAMDCWVTGNLFGKGPLVHPIVPSSSGPVQKFVEALSTDRVTLRVFILAGSFVLERQGDTNASQVVSRTRPSQTINDGVRFRGAYSGSVDALYVGWGDGVLEEWDGTSWKNCLLPSGFMANFLCVVGDELWAADSIHSTIRKCTGDPKVAGSWSGPILVGSPSIQITAIRQTTNRLVIFKADGDVFTINGDGSDNDLFPGLQTTVDGQNARTAAAWLGSLYFRAGRAFYQLDMQGGAVLTPIGPGRQLGNLSEVRGPVQAFAGWNSQMAFGAIWNFTTQTSYLLTYGNWEPQAGDSGTDYTFTTQWDGAIAHWGNRIVTALFVSNIPSDARLYIGFNDGGYDWIKLVPYPLAADSGAEFNNGGYIVAPLHHDMFQVDTKQTIGFSVHGPYFPADSRVSISYRLRGGAGMPMSTPPVGSAAYGDFLSAGPAFTFNGERHDMNWNVAGIGLEMKVDLASSGSSTTPILEGIGLHERLVPAFRRDFQFTVDARDRIARRDGASTRLSGRKIRDLVMQAAARPATVALEFPDETILDVALFDYAERQAAHTSVGGQGWALDIQATQFGIESVYGIIGRTRGTRIGDLRGWKISQLKRF